MKNEDIFLFISLIIGFVTILFFAIIASTFLGAFVGMIVGFVFPQVIDAINQITKLNLSGWDIGATLGFVSGFFRTSFTNNKNK